MLIKLVQTKSIGINASLITRKFHGIERKLRLDRRLWQPWFAWRPVRETRSGNVLWLEIVMRRNLYCNDSAYAALPPSPGYDHRWIYRRIDTQILCDRPYGIIPGNND